MMGGAELLTGNEKLSILQCQSLAEDIGFDCTEFDLVGPTGRLRCKWLDAYMGAFVIVGKETAGFNMVKDFQYLANVYCENVAGGKA